MDSRKYQKIAEGIHKVVTTEIVPVLESRRVKGIRWYFKVLDGKNAGTITYRHYANSEGGRWHLLSDCKLLGVTVQEAKEILGRVEELKGKVIRMKTEPDKDSPYQRHEFLGLVEDESESETPGAHEEEGGSDELVW